MRKVELLPTRDCEAGYGSGRVPLETSDREISAYLPGKERLGKEEKWSRKEGKSKKRRWKIENGKRKRYKLRRGPLFF